MTSAARDSFVDLEKLRQGLEQNIQKLQRSLQHWQTWEFEYEAFKEELTALPTKSSRSDLLNVCQSFDGDLVNQKEVNDLSGRDKGTERTRDQIINLVSRRVDYVNENIKTIQKQLSQAQVKRDQLTVITRPDVRNDEGLPITEIFEELDEDGNAISGKLVDPNDQTPQMVEALKKVGVEVENGSRPDRTSYAIEPRNNVRGDGPSPHTPQDLSEPQSSVTVDTAGDSQPSVPKKSVSFATDTKPPSPAVSKQNLKSSSSTTSVVKDSFAPTDRVIELDENDHIVSTAPGAPINESAEDAALRREMLQYSMSEVGSIVAELDLEEQGETDDEVGSDELEWGEVSDGDEENLSEEDEHGLSRRTGMSDAYRQEMLDLEQKMQARMMENVGPRPSTDAINDGELAQSVRRLRVRNEGESNDEIQDRKPEKPGPKAVRFAEEPSIQNLAPEKPSDRQVTSPPNPLHQSIIERPPSTSSTTTSSAPQIQSQRKQSRFKAEHTSSSQQPRSSTTAPAPPPNQPLASFVRERSPQRIPQPPNELDANVLQDELRTAYEQQRRKMTQQQVNPVEEHPKPAIGDGDMPQEVYEDVEDDGAAPKKKMSRFKAARMQRDRVW